MGYQIGFTDAAIPLHFMIPITIVALAGLSGIEGLFFMKASADLKGFHMDGNYQRQSSIALLSYAVIAVLVYLCDWGIHAELTILFAYVFFNRIIYQSCS